MRRITSKPSLCRVAVSALNADRNSQSKDMESQCDRHRNTPFTEDSGENRPSLCWRPWGSKEPYIFYQTNRKMSIHVPSFSTLDKSQESAIIKITQGPATSGFASGQITESRRTRNRHLPEWRFRHVMRMVTVKPRIWNVIVTGIYIPPFGRQNRPSLRWGLRGSSEPYVFYQINRNLSTKPPLDKSGASAIIKITQGPFRKNGLASD